MSATASTEPLPTEPQPLLEGEGLLSTLATRRAPSANPSTHCTPNHYFDAKAAAPAPQSILRSTPMAAPNKNGAGLTPAPVMGSHRAPGTKPQEDRRVMGRPAHAFSEKEPAAEGLEPAATPGEHLLQARTSRFVHTSAHCDPSEEILELEKTEVLQDVQEDGNVGADTGAGGAISLRRPSRIILGPGAAHPAPSKPPVMPTGALFQACAELRRHAHTPALRVSAAAHFVSLCLKSTPDGAASWADLKSWATLYGFTESEVAAAVGWVEGIKEGVFLAPTSAEP